MRGARVGLALVLSLMIAAAAAAQARRVHVMIANDDGIEAPGIETLVRVVAADPAYRVTVVAPAHQQSAVGHSLTIRRSIKVAPHRPMAGSPAWAVDATPATTVRVGLAAILKDDPPDLVLSGINRGENVGLIALYSGTVGAASEATVFGIPAVALSLALDWGDPRPDYAAAARAVKPVIDAVREHGLAAGVLLNVNVPKTTQQARGYRLTRMGLAGDLGSSYELLREKNGVRWFAGHWVPPVETDITVDVAALAAGWVTLTPLRLDWTAYRAFPELDWTAGLPAPQKLLEPAPAP